VSLKLICCAALGLALIPTAVSAAPVTEDLWYYSTISSGVAGPIRLRAELNYDDARTDAPIAIVMHGYSPSSGTLANVRAQAQRLRNSGFFAVSVAMRGRDGSAGVRDSGGLEIHDIYDAAETVKLDYAGFVDSSNVHITGYSGGGCNAMSAVVRYPDYFRVASSFFGMADYGFDPVDGWYNFGAGGRTSQLDQDIGNPNTGGPAVVDRYRARASTLAAANSSGVEVHLFANDNESICPPVNHINFAAVGGSHVTAHFGISAAPTYEDFNGNGVEDPGERQLWPHGFPDANQQAAGEGWYLDRLLAGDIPQPEIATNGTLVVAGYLVTKHFEIWIGDGQSAAGEVAYSLGTSSASLTPVITGSNTSLPVAIVVQSGFLSPTGALVNARRNGVWIGSFLAGERHVFSGFADGDLLELDVAPAVSGLPAAIWAVALLAGTLARAGYRHLR
jgi:pimeloyl-ACP methyl ester carboxylesterase